MIPTTRRMATLLLVLALGGPACTTAAGGQTAPPTAATAATTSSTTMTTIIPPTTTRPRAITEETWTPFAVAGGVVTLTHPSSRVERVAFHESNHDGARPLQALATAASPLMLESRERGTAAQTAADVVADPGVEVRAPVTGRVKRGGSYVLYCKHHDDYVVIAPDGRPDWEVKVLHIDGLRVRRGQLVVAGRTIIAAHPRQLPFASQVDDVRTAEPAWPHVHIEVVDPAIPDRPSPGRGCS